MRAPRISDLKHRVVLCRMDDVVASDGVMELRRDAVLSAWVSIVAKQASMFSTENVAIKESQDRQTHLITMRFRRDIDISAMAWVYEKRMQSGDRWFKVLGIKEQSEDGQFMVLSCRLVERGETMSKPAEPVTTAGLDLARPTPKGIEL